MRGNAATQARRMRSLDLRLSGMSYRQIAAVTGVGLSTAFRDVEAQMSEYAQEPATQLRDLHIARLDRLLMGIWPAAARGDAEAIRAALQVLDRQSKLLGLDAPQRVDITAWIRTKALEEGLDPDEAVRMAEAIARGEA